ncbi:helix-turn-helix domain-containing protein [Amycolatopsis sp. NPDC059657]|uniref:helix-turn-helix domain-containing protein n=1 Tax=Amycolatopsis sp. NPDC059657 TaxID=3346899 RepID=UPI00366D3BC4
MTTTGIPGGNMGLMTRHACPQGKWEVVEAVPGRRLRPGVRCYRGFHFTLDEVRRRLEVPVGLVTVVLNFDRELRLASTSSAAPTPLSLTSLVAGVRTCATVGEHDGHLHGMEVMLEPWAAFTLFDTPLRELKNRIVDASDLLDTRVRRLTDALASTADWAGRFALLDFVLGRWWAAGPACSPHVVRAWQLLTRSGGMVSIAKLADDVGWSERQLERRFAEQIGQLPKAAARIMRFQRAMPKLLTRAPAAEIAALCGYSDQAHLNREFMSMTGRTISQFLVEHHTTGSGPLVRQRVAGEVTSVPLPSDVGFLQESITPHDPGFSVPGLAGRGLQGSRSTIRKGSESCA